MDIGVTIMMAVSSRSETLERTLDSLSRCRIPDTLSQVLIIENGEEPVLAELINKFRDRLPVEHQFTDAKGKSRALNYGIKNFVSDGEFVIFTDDDIRFEESWIVNYDRAFHANGSGFFYGGAFAVDYECAPNPLLKHKLPDSGRGIGEEVFQANDDKNFYGFNWAAKKDDLVRAGLFDENLSHGSETGATGEETQAQKKLRMLGVRRVVVRGNTVFHFVPASKCSYDWIKARSKTIGVEKYWTTKNRISWVVKRIGRMSSYALLMGVGRRTGYYSFVLEGVKLSAFLKEWRVNGLATEVNVAGERISQRCTGN